MSWLLLFALGATAIAGLPPLNGFVSEWLVYLGFFPVLLLLLLVLLYLDLEEVRLKVRLHENLRSFQEHS